jgi:Cof subfamily protein (haloacid dehalogenase superfamily)
MNKIKAIFFDIDGTLIPFGRKEMSKETIDALNMLKEKGVKIFVASGRGILEQGVVTKDVAFDGYITLNGQICLDKDYNLYHGNSIHPEDFEVLHRVFQNKELPAVLIEEKRAYINYVDEFAEKIHKEIGIKASPIDVYKGDKVYQMILYADTAYAEKLFEKLPHCQWSRWHPHGIDIFSKEGGKVAGIKKTLEYFGIQQEETMAFGDGDNDMEMLDFVKYGVAMGNAQDKTKAAADYITAASDDNGIVKALEHFGLYKKG